MAYNSCRINEAQKSVLKYKPTNNHNHVLAKKDISFLKNHKNTIVFITLNDNEAFWFYIKDFFEDQLIGFIEQNNHWVYRVIRLSKIHTFS